ncbi:MAG: hypothetical protein LRY55_16000 [Leadbetterella sp.]|nr:hypothetical protein [Leadbetterella sp.]
MAQGPVLAFARTNAQGYYKITYRGSADSLKIFAQAMAYGEQHQEVTAGKNTYDFSLRPSSRHLEEILVRPPVSRRNDTLSYSVDHFTRAGDRTLADVMKRIPGLEVSRSGQITYRAIPLKNTILKGWIYWEDATGWPIIISRP